MKVLGKRFHSLDCLDIDYHAFKVDFFQASNEKQEFFNDCFLRNLPICRGISAYSRQFQEYLSKKAKLTLTKNRKNRFKDRPEKTEASKRESEATDREAAKSANRAYFAHEKPIKEPKTQQLPLLREASCKAESPERKSEQNAQKDIEKMLDMNLKDIEVERRKTSYQIKNVCFTLSKIFPSHPNQKEVKKNLKQINKEKLKMYGALKKGKLSLRTTKFVQSDKFVRRPAFECQPLGATLQGFSLNHSIADIFQNLSSYPNQNKRPKFSKESLIPKSQAQKQQMRKLQLSATHKVAFQRGNCEGSMNPIIELQEAQFLLNENSCAQS